MDKFKFPRDFRFGTATAAYQIEGYPLEDGGVPSIWHEFCRKPGKIDGGDTGDTACDHYHRFEEDFDILQKMGCDSYRFSTAWTRIVPEPGTVNQKGIDFYSRLVDSLLSRGIEPMITLFHWETPVWLEKAGGFTSRDSVDHFRFFCKTVYKALGDRVKKWVTVNEPMVYTVNGYHTGEFPPGKKFNLKGVFRAAHYLLMSHAEAVRTGHDLVPGSSIGIAEAQVWMDPLRKDNEKDAAAAARMDDIANRLYIDPVYFGTYPASVLSAAGKMLPEDFERDMEAIKEPGDFTGINYYMRRSYKYAWYMPMTRAKLVPTPGAENSAMWEVYPDGLYKLLVRLKDEYGNPPCYITENGYPLKEEDGKPVLEDFPRIDYLERHFSSAARAIREGVNLKGYYVWSLLDNFEWNLGNAMRFGLIRTDFESLERTWKKSATWYKEFIQRNRL